MIASDGSTRSQRDATNADNQIGNKNLSIQDVVESMDPAFRDAYKDPGDIQNYRQEGSCFHGKNISEIRDMVKKNALEHGLHPSQLADFKKGSKLWKNEKEDEGAVRSPTPTEYQQAKTDDSDELIYWHDDENGVRFNQGNLYRLTRSEKRTNARLLLSAPLTLIATVKTDDGIKVRYMFNGETKTTSLKEMVTDISVNMHSTREVNKNLSELLYRYVIKITCIGREP